MTNNERFNALLNNCHSSRAVYAALWALGSTGALDKLREEARYPAMADFQNHKRLGF